MRTRCDKAMRRSKERCYTPFHRRWRCNADCRSCVCCIVTEPDGTEKHLGNGMRLEGNHERAKE